MKRFYWFAHIRKMHQTFSGPQYYKDIPGFYWSPIL